MSHPEQPTDNVLRPPPGPVEQGEAALERIYGAGVLPGLDLSSLPDAFQTLLGGEADPRDPAVQQEVLQHLQSADGGSTRRLLEMLVGKTELDQLLVSTAEQGAAQETTPELREKLEQVLLGLTTGTVRKDIRKNAARLHFGKVDPIRKAETRVGRNDPCPCGSGKKFKHCCLRH